LYVFSSVFTGGGTTSTQNVTLTVVPKSSGEGITLENVYLTDSAGIPQGGFVPGSNAQLNVWRLSTFPTNAPATLRYTVTGPNSSSVLDQPLDIRILTGGSLGSIPLALGSSAVAGNYTFQATVTYQDSNFATKTSTMSVPFTVAAAPTPLKGTLATMHPYVLDLDLVYRTSFSPGEALVLSRAVYSTFPSPVTGTVQYQIAGPFGLILDGVVNATFAPGMNVAFAPVGTPVNIAPGRYTLTTIATTSGQSIGNSTSFDIAGGAAPSFSSTIEPATSGMIQIDGKLRETPLPSDRFVNDGSFQAGRQR
jgi:hypothetical protein